MVTSANEWPAINLAWRQRVAASWSITWPCWLLSFLVIFFVPVVYARGESAGHLQAASVIAAVVFFLTQALLVPRLVKKQYRTFRVTAIREDGQSVHGLSAYETLSIWLRIVWPQVVFLLAIFIITSWPTYHLDAPTRNSINSLSLWLRILVIGPASIQIAMQAKYSGFHLQAHGQRYI